MISTATAPPTAPYVVVEVLDAPAEPAELEPLLPGAGEGAEVVVMVVAALTGANVGACVTTITGWPTRALDQALLVCAVIVETTPGLFLLPVRAVMRVEGAILAVGGVLMTVFTTTPLLLASSRRPDVDDKAVALTWI